MSAILKQRAFHSSIPGPPLDNPPFPPLISTQASWLSAVYQYKNGVMTPSTENGVTQPKASIGASKSNYEDMNKWFATLMSNTFA